jgi:hypothetical protein
LYQHFTNLGALLEHYIKTRYEGAEKNLFAVLGIAARARNYVDYPRRLLSGSQSVKRFLCLVPVDKDNYTRLVKLLILLYAHNNKNITYPMGHGNWESPPIPYIISDSSI